jgi:putative endonuclease
MREYHFFVYILTNSSRHPLYVGFTNSVGFRHWQHKEKIDSGSFTARYNLTRLVYYERYRYVRNAIAREKQLKSWTRRKKIALIEEANPGWDDLSRYEPKRRFEDQNIDPSTRSGRKLPALAQDDKINGVLVSPNGRRK